MDERDYSAMNNIPFGYTIQVSHKDGNYTFSFGDYTYVTTSNMASGRGLVFRQIARAHKMTGREKIFMNQITFVEI